MLEANIASCLTPKSSILQLTSLQIWSWRYEIVCSIHQRAVFLLYKYIGVKELSLRRLEWRLKESQGQFPGLISSIRNTRVGLSGFLCSWVHRPWYGDALVTGKHAKWFLVQWGFRDVRVCVIGGQRGKNMHGRVSVMKLPWGMLLRMLIFWDAHSSKI